MDNPQVEHELEDLESRLERLRALYEQYFLGLEKLEPRVLRKDVDRKFWVLRREQIRNTGLRFKFQMLVQRYNTYQQYWHRVVREIESGTYRRDVIKVAKRFGEKDAMTILGRKRADQYRRLAVNQEERRNARKGGASDNAGDAHAPADAIEEGPVSMSADDVELMDDDDDESAAITPPRVMPGVRPRIEPDMESLLSFATVGVTSWGGGPKEKPAARPNRTPVSDDDTPVVPPDPALLKPEAAPEKVVAAPEKVVAAQGKTVTAPAAVQGKSRVAELAAQMRAKKQAEPAKKTVDLGLDDLFDAAPAAAKPAPVAAQRPAPVAAAPQPKPTPAPVVTAPQPRPTPASVVPAPQPRPAPLPVVPAAQPRPPAAHEDLSEQKMRAIYAKYVGAKRAANESTAGVTFDKLAASLRAQADKLKVSHPSRTVDFEIVTKDGKTALRPVIK